MKIITFAVATLLLTLTFGCSKAPTDMLVGKWKGVGNDPLIIEYFSDGTYASEAKMRDSKIDVNGNWTILKDGRLQIDFTVMGKSMTTLLELSIDGDSMKVTNGKGKTLESIRIK